MLTENVLAKNRRFSKDIKPAPLFKKLVQNSRVSQNYVKNKNNLKT